MKQTCRRSVGMLAASLTALMLTDLSFGIDPVIVSSSPSIALKSSSNSRLIWGAVLEIETTKITACLHKRKGKESLEPKTTIVMDKKFKMLKNLLLFKLD